MRTTLLANKRQIRTTQSNCNKEEYQRHLFDQVGERLEVKVVDDWYYATGADVCAVGGKKVLCGYYSGSLSSALSNIYRNHVWDVSRFRIVPRNHWTSREALLHVFDFVGEELAIKSLDDWYRVRKRDFADLGFSRVIDKFAGSISTALESIFPAHLWNPWRFVSAPQRFWHDVSNQRLRFEEAAAILNLKTLDLWYRVDLQRLLNVDARMAAILEPYDSSLPRALAAIYPNFSWRLSLFTATPKGYLDDVENQRRVFDQAGQQLNVKLVEDWYHINKALLAPTAAIKIVAKFGSLKDTLSVLYPEMKWMKMRFKKRASEHLLSNQRLWMSRLAQKLNVKTVEGWVGVTTRGLEAVGGRHILHRYDGSLYKALRVLYPNESWRTLEYKENKYWQGGTNVKHFLNNIAETLHITNPAAWYRVSKRQILKRGGAGVLPYWPKALKTLYPDQDWELYNPQKKAEQRLLVSATESVFGGLAKVMTKPSVERLHPIKTRQPSQVEYTPLYKLARRRIRRRIVGITLPTHAMDVSLPQSWTVPNLHL